MTSQGRKASRLEAEKLLCGKQMSAWPSLTMRGGLCSKGLAGLLPVCHTQFLFHCSYL